MLFFWVGDRWAGRALLLGVCDSAGCRVGAGNIGRGYQARGISKPPSFAHHFLRSLYPECLTCIVSLLYQDPAAWFTGSRSFGRLSLTRQGLLQRNNLVYLTALQAGVPTVITMGGGYTKPMQRSVECHTDVYRAAAYRLNAWQVARRRGSGTTTVAAVGQ